MFSLLNTLVLSFKSFFLVFSSYSLNLFFLSTSTNYPFPYFDELEEEYFCLKFSIFYGKIFFLFGFDFSLTFSSEFINFSRIYLFLLLVLEFLYLDGELILNVSFVVLKMYLTCLRSIGIKIWSIFEQSSNDGLGLANNFYFS